MPARKLPRRLYKYRNDDANGSRLLLDGELWFASFESLNDPGDGVVSVHLNGPQNTALIQSRVYEAAKLKWPDRSDQDWRDAAIVTTSARRSDLVNGLSQWTEAKLVAERKQPATIFCISGDCRNSVMWAHYATNHSGICIELDTRDRTFRSARPIEYVDEAIPYSAAEIVISEKLRDSAPWLFRKSNLWNYEKEWRVIRHGMPVGVQRIQRRSVTSVILGCRMPEPRRQWYRNALRFRNIRIFQASLAKGSNHKLLIEPVEKP